VRHALNSHRYMRQRYSLFVITIWGYTSGVLYL